MSLLAYDQGFPSLVSVQALLIVNILRNQNPPVFINEPYSTTISQNQGTFQSIITVTATDADITVSKLPTECAISQLFCVYKQDNIWFDYLLVADNFCHKSMHVMVEINGIFIKCGRIILFLISTLVIWANSIYFSIFPGIIINSLYDCQISVFKFLLFCWQNPFNQLEYSIIGDDAAPTYFAINSGGMITLRQSIPSINTDIYNVSNWYLLLTKFWAQKDKRRVQRDIIIGYYYKAVNKFLKWPFKVIFNTNLMWMDKINWYQLDNIIIYDLNKNRQWFWHLEMGWGGVFLHAFKFYM